MKRLVVSILGGLIGGLGLWACDSDSSSGGGGTFTPDGGSFESGTVTPEGGARAYEVECTHPGAKQPPLANGMCDCTQSLVVLTGIWDGRYTCGENGACVDTNLGETFTFLQTGNKIVATEGPQDTPTFRFEGTVCQDWFTWTGGPTDGKYVECGTIHFTDANHYVKDSCYQYATDAGADGGTACQPTFASGCAGQSGQCTNTGARQPEQAAAVTKVICQ